MPNWVKDGMRKNNVLVTGLPRAAALLVALAATGCATLGSMPESLPEPATPQPVVVIETPAPIPKNDPPPPVRVIPEPAPLPPVAIVLTSNQPAYADIARELTSSLENYEIYDLSDDTRPPVSVLRLINDSDSGAIVAIGLRAAKSSIAMSEKPVVFSQVFNYQDHGLLTENSRGISAVAPLEAQIAAWKAYYPSLSQVGAIVGEGHDDLIADARIAAEKHGVELLIRVTHSDQETLYFFKRMIRDIDGFWLLPDNRVLSRRALQQIMDDAQQQKVPVLVPSESMLKIGASISISSVASDIAEAIAKVIHEIQTGSITKVPPISPLSKIDVRTNTAVQVVKR